MSESTTTNKVRLDPSKYGYQTNKDFRTPSGRSTIDNGDKVAEVLRGMSLAGVFTVLQANGGEVSPDWQHLNLGMQRMAAGNVLRRIARKLDAEGGTLVVPDEALATVTKVDPEARERAKAEREAKALEAKTEREAKLATLKAEREQKAAQAKAEREQKAAEVKAERERKAAEAQAAKEAKAAEAQAAKEAKAQAAKAVADASTDAATVEEVAETETKQRGRRKQANAL